MSDPSRNFPSNIDVQQCIDCLNQTEAGQQALSHLWQGLIEWGESVSEHGKGEQAEAFSKIVIHAILYGDYAAVADTLKADFRKSSTQEAAKA